MAHTLEIVDGSLYSLGDNDYGQLGVGNIQRYDTKQKVITGIPLYDNIPWIDAKTGLNHSVGIKKDKSIWFWGSNIEGQMGRPASIKYLDKPTKIDFQLDSSKNININTGLYFTIISQTSAKSFGLGTFQNLRSNIVEVYREITPLYFFNQDGDIFLTLNTGPKTIVGRISDFGYVYSDWSGDLYPSEYVRFSALRNGDYFTLYDPSNRSRLLYKKVDTYQIADGCCKINAACMHRRYSELLNYVTIVHPSLSGFAVEELLGTDRERLVPSKEQYGSVFVFNSALAGMATMDRNFSNTIDPITLKGIYLATGKKNMLDVLLYGGLYFSPNISDPLNINTVVEKIDAREVFKKDIFPPYFEDISQYRLLEGDAYNPDPLQELNKYDRANPMYYFKLDSKKNPIKYKTCNRGLPYAGPIERISELEKNIFRLYYNNDEGYANEKRGFFYTQFKKDNPDEPIILKKEINLPADENNRLIVEDLSLTNPYLIKYDVTEGQSSFSQNFLDLYYRVKPQDPANAGIACNDPGTRSGAIQTIPEADTKWLYECQYQTPTQTYPTYNIGIYAQQLIEYFLNPKTDPEETNKFFGFAKFELEELYTTIKNGDHTKPNYPVVKQSFELLRDILHSQINNKLYFSPKTNEPIFKIDSSGNSEFSETLSFTSAIRSYPPRGGPIDGHHRIKIPFKKITCFTYFQRIATIENNKLTYIYKPDKNTLIVPIDVTSNIIATTTKISYWIPKIIDKNGRFEKNQNNLVQQTAIINITNVVYDPTANITKISLDSPFGIDYIIGCIPYNGPPPGCGPIIAPEIYYNNPFNLPKALQDTTGSL